MHKTNIIIGGGLSGLLAAWRLQQKGLPYLLLEAKPLLGGRILGVKDGETDHFHDLGPTWIFPHQNNIQSLLNEFNIPYFEQYTKGAALFQKQGNSSIIRTEGAGAMSMYRIQGGVTSLINTLASKLNNNNIYTNHAVTHITKSDGNWAISGQHKNNTFTFSAVNLILALPPRIINKHLTPEHWASAELKLAFQQVPTWMAAQAKFIATYKTPFWREENLSGQVFSQQGPMQEMHDASSSTKAPYALFGFIGISAQYRPQYKTADIKQACLNQLHQLYGKQATQIEHILFKDWATDEYVASESDIKEPSKHPHFELNAFKQELTENNIYLAGSEFSSTDAGYLEGAVCAVNSVITNLVKQH